MLVRRKLISYCNSKNNAISTFLSFCDIIFKFDEFAAFINEQHGDSVAVDIAITDIETIGDDVSKKITAVTRKFFDLSILIRVQSSLPVY